jgi:hypothetical protein
MITVHRIDRAKDVEIHVVLFQETEPLHHAVKRSLTRSVCPAGIVQFPWSSDTDTNSKPVFPEKIAPLVVQQDSIRLDGVMDHHAGPAIVFLNEHSLFKKIPAQECRLATLPCKGYFRYAVCFYGLPDVLLENFIGHAEPAFRIQFSLAKVEAILAGQVTPGATGFGHEMKPWEWAGGHEGNTRNLLGNKKGLMYALGGSDR